MGAAVDAYVYAHIYVSLYIIRILSQIATGHGSVIKTCTRTVLRSCIHSWVRPPNGPAIHKN